MSRSRYVLLLRQWAALNELLTALLYLHRKHFAESLLKFPHNPLCSKYAHSTLVAYRQASATIHFSVEEYQHFPRLLNRHWGFWTQVFGSAIIVGSIVTRSPTSSMAENSFKELCLALELLEKGAVESPRAKVAMASGWIRGLPVILLIYLNSITGYHQEAEGKFHRSSCINKNSWHNPSQRSGQHLRRGRARNICWSFSP